MAFFLTVKVMPNRRVQRVFYENRPAFVTFRFQFLRSHKLDLDWVLRVRRVFFDNVHGWLLKLFPLSQAAISIEEQAMSEAHFKR